MNNKKINNEPIAYFSMEIGLKSDLPTYSGGLGVLAGDLLKAYTDMGLSVIGITLLNEKGYFNQVIDNHGQQIEKPVNWNVSKDLDLLPNSVSVKIENRNVKVNAWIKTIDSIDDHKNIIIFLDTNDKKNNSYDRTLTSNLYGGDRYYRLCQEIILGIGGIKMLNSLGFKNIKKYHLNEGHAALLTIELLQDHLKNNKKASLEDTISLIRNKCIFTTHTPIAAGHDHFEKKLFNDVLGDYIPKFIYSKIIDNGEISMTHLGLYMSGFVNGVAKRHTTVTAKMFPTYHINSITNGVHPYTWTSKHFRKIFDNYLPGWEQDPHNLRNVLSVPKEDIWQAHQSAKEELIEFVYKKNKIKFNQNTIIIGFARRFTAYKRAGLIFHDINKLKKIAVKNPLQIIIAGKAHPNDRGGKKLIKEIFDIAQTINNSTNNIKIAFIENYDMKIAQLMTAGCDVWLNTPQRPFEASGTSGMKAALNGVPHLSTIDGWWVEGYIENITGWAIGAHPHDKNFNKKKTTKEDAKDLYHELTDKVLPIYYHDRDRWIYIMKNCIAINGSFFNTYRMASQYITNAYLN